MKSAILLIVMTTVVFAAERPGVVFVLTKEKNKFKQLSAMMISAQDKEIYLCDSEAQNIRIFTFDGAEQTWFPAKRPAGVTRDSGGNFYVLETDDNGSDFIGIYDNKFQKKDSVKITDSPFPPTGKFGQIAIDNDDKLYIVDEGSNVVLSVSTEGKYLRHFGKFPQEENGKTLPSISDICVDGKNKKLYIADAISSKIYVYKLNGKYLFEFGKGGGIMGELSQPCSVAVDAGENAYVLDKMRHTIIVHDKAGKFIYEIGGKGEAEGWFYFPRYIAMDSDKNLYVLETMINRFQALTIEKKNEK